MAYSGLSPVKRSTFSRILSAKAFARFSIDVRQQDAKLFAADARKKVIWPYAFPNDIHHCFYHLIANRMPPSVVDFFEVVDIHNHDAIRRFLADAD